MITRRLVKPVFIRSIKEGKQDTSIWLLQKFGYDFQDKINPQTLTTLTILIAESNPNDKDKMIGITGLLLNPLGESR